MVVLTGIPGSGSTTLLNKALEEVDYVHLNYGDIMTEIEIQEKAAKRIKERSESENVIVDTHCTINTPSGFLPGLPIWVLNELQPNLFVMIEANPDEIIYRRLNDDTRSRDIERAKDIQLHQEMNRAASMAYATLTGATVKIIENHDNHLPSTVSKLVDVLNK